LAAAIGLAALADATVDLPWMFSGDTSRSETSSGESPVAATMTLSAHSAASSDAVHDGLLEFVFRSWDADESESISVKRYPFKAFKLIIR
jgi:hypothetical protein